MMNRRIVGRLSLFGLGLAVGCTGGDDGSSPTGAAMTEGATGTNGTDGPDESTTAGPAATDTTGPGNDDDPDTTAGAEGPDTTGVDTGTDTSGGETTTGGEEVGRFVGNITTNGMVRPDFVDYWNQITPENEGKWGSVEGTRDVMNWGPLDAAYDYALDHGIPFKGHVLVWGSQQPNWIAGLPPAEQAEEVEEWIRLYCERYPETAILDVVNEPPPHTTPPYMNAIGGPGASGYDWIIWSFQTARQYCPNTILVLNDYNVLRWNTASFVNIVNAVKGSGFVDAIGAQAHGLETLPFGELQANLQAVLSTGLPLYISEYDIDVADDEQQRAIMEEQFTLFWETEEIVGITLWGYVYGSTWLPNTGLLVDGQPRPAMTWLMDYLDAQGS